MRGNTKANQTNNLPKPSDKEEAKSESLRDAKDEPVAPVEMKEEQTSQPKSKGHFKNLVVNFIYA